MKKNSGHPLLDIKVRNETYNQTKSPTQPPCVYITHQPLLMFASLDPVVALNKSHSYICLTLSVFYYDQTFEIVYLLRAI